MVFLVGTLICQEFHIFPVQVRVNKYILFKLHLFMLHFILGVNSGVILMNLTRMRKSNVEQELIIYYNEFKQQIEKGFQDLINIYFYYNPKKIYVLPCNFNYRANHWYEYNSNKKIQIFKMSFLALQCL